MIVFKILKSSNKNDTRKESVTWERTINKKRHTRRIVHYVFFDLLGNCIYMPNNDLSEKNLV